MAKRTEMIYEIHNGEDTVKVVDIESYEAALQLIKELEAKLWVAKDSQLRTYDGLAERADQADELKKKLELAIAHLVDMTNDEDSFAADKAASLLLKLR